MSKIHVLNQDTINKIAAGEVIERPMAVVKELTENAIDADATAVTVEVKDGGKALIRMTDNGVGMNKEDIRLAFTPHATSKIEDAKDLLKVATLGFRGEALASISSVSQLEMVTKTRNELMDRVMKQTVVWSVRWRMWDVRTERRSLCAICFIIHRHA